MIKAQFLTINNHKTIGEDKEIVKDNWLAMCNGSSVFVFA